jgi:hypothetical protein
VSTSGAGAPPRHRNRAADAAVVTVAGSSQRGGEPLNVSSTDHLLRRVSAEQDDVLASLSLVRGEHDLEDRLFSRLVDLLVESVFLDLRRQYAHGDVDPERLTHETAVLARACHAAGLLPLARRAS